MDKLWRQSPIEQLPETYGDDFEPTFDHCFECLQPIKPHYI